MGLIDKIKINKLCDKYKEKSIKEGKYYFLAEEKYRKFILNCPSELSTYKDWDEYGSIPLELGKRLELLIDDENYKPFIHRTAVFSEEKLYDNKTLNNILTTGLVNNGHSHTNGSKRVDNPPITDTADYVDSTLFMQILLKTHRNDSFGKQTQGSVIFILPKDYVDDEGEVIVDPKLVYNYDEEGIPHIKPEFILGITTLNDENYLGECKYYSKEEILENQKLDSKTK